MSLVICGECNRHVRRVESRCPFCNAEIPLALAQSVERTLPTRRLSRGALITFAAASFSTGVPRRAVVAPRVAVALTTPGRRSRTPPRTPLRRTEEQYQVALCPERT